MGERTHIARSGVEPLDDESARSLAGLSIEPMSPAMADRLHRFHERLSAETVRRRFFSAHPHLSPAEVGRFSDVDHLDREALVALDRSGEIVGVARFDRVAPKAGTAEVAFVVADAWQHHGLGSELFDRLAQRARKVRVDRFVAETMIDNRAMRAVFGHSRYPTHEGVANGFATVVIDLSRRHDQVRR